MIRRLSAIVPLLLTLAAPLRAQNVCTSGSPADGPRLLGRTTGLTGPFVLFDFNGLPLLGSGDPISGTLQNTGVQISVSGAFYGPTGSIFYSPFAFPDDGIFNYSNGAFASPEITIVFNAPARGVAFNFATDGAASTFKAWKNGVVVNNGTINSVFPGVTSSNLDCWWGFQFDDGTTFDKLTIVGSPYAFGFDNLQVKTATVVPEPATVGLLAVGLAGVLVMRRRRRNSRED